MIKSSYIREILKIENNNKVFKIKGWIKNKRFNKKIGFININDGTTFNNLQIVIKSQSLINFEECSSFGLYTCIEVLGKLKFTPNAKQSFEIETSEINLLSNSNLDYPLQKKEHTDEFLREIAHLRSRTRKYWAISKIRSDLIWIINKYFYENNFVNIHTPIITSNDAEGAGESFAVRKNLDVSVDKDFFGKNAFLTVSGQLHVESFAQIFGKTYTFGPTFRAEKSNTVKHAAEFWMLEPEIAFCDINGLMMNIEDLVKYVIKNILKSSKEELLFLSSNEHINWLNIIADSNFHKITYKEAIDIINNIDPEKHNFVNNKLVFGDDLQTEHEKYIANIHFNSPCFVYNYPSVIKAFYMKENNDDTVAACDLLIPNIGELVGGSQREDNYNKIIEKCKKQNINIESLKWYLDLRKYGYYMSSGYGLGFERLIMFITNVENIKDVLPFPRTNKNLIF